MIEVNGDSLIWRSGRTAKWEEKYPPVWVSGLQKRGDSNGQGDVPLVPATTKLWAG